MVALFSARVIIDARPQQLRARGEVATVAMVATGPAPKKARRCTPLARVTAEDRARQFKTELYADDGVLFCHYCDHSLDFTRVDMVKDHLKSTLRSTYVPRLFESHFSTLKSFLCDKYVSITADETTDVRDHSILNVIASVRGKSYLIGVVKMDACNHSTFSQAIIKAVSEIGINFNCAISATMLHTARKHIEMYYRLSTLTHFMCFILPTLLTWYLKFSTIFLILSTHLT